MENVLTQAANRLITLQPDLFAFTEATALRWIQKLHFDGLVGRQADPLDARRVWIELSAKGIAAMDQYFNRLALQPL